MEKGYLRNIDFHAFIQETTLLVVDICKNFMEMPRDYCGLAHTFDADPNPNSITLSKNKPALRI